MALTCMVGFHQWNGCKCSGCGKTRDREHDWTKDCSTCSRCRQTRPDSHDWTGDCGCCRRCGVTRKGAHRLEAGKCKISGRAPANWLLVDHVVTVTGQFMQQTAAERLNQQPWWIGTWLRLLSLHGSNEMEVRDLERDIAVMAKTLRCYLTGIQEKTIDQTGRVCDAQKCLEMFDAAFNDEEVGALAALREARHRRAVVTAHCEGVSFAVDSDFAQRCKTSGSDDCVSMWPATDKDLFNLKMLDSRPTPRIIPGEFWEGGCRYGLDPAKFVPCLVGPHTVRLHRNLLPFISGRVLRPINVKYLTSAQEQRRIGIGAIEPILPLR